MKKLFNSAETMVDDMLDGFVNAFPQAQRGVSDPQVIKRARDVKEADEKVTLLIGNGSGHDPIAMEFLGQGLVDANIVGDVFAAPSAVLILDGLAEVTGKALNPPDLATFLGYDQRTRGDDDGGRYGGKDHAAADV